MVGLAFWFRDYHDLIQVSMSFGFLVALAVLFVPESPRWLITKGKYVFEVENFGALL